MDVFNFAFMHDGNLLTGSSPSKEVFLRIYPSVKQYKELSEDDVDFLENNQFLNALFLDEDCKFKVDLSKAKEIHKEKLRQERKPLLEDLDVKFILALEQDDLNKKNEIVERKKYLRGITSLVDSCSTLEEVLNIKCN
jgi:DNA repair exonuclease SbcCD nuclease subunit